ncbi:MAG: 3-deoxy-manno-octulosonate cytidylyltransferase [bacterium]
MEILAVIPARYQSSRFPGKPLVEIKGVSMIKRTYNQVLKSKALDWTVVATDSKKIFDHCKKENIEVVMTSDDCATGTDRVAEIAKIFSNYDLYVNIQGDEPVISPEVIKEIVGSYKKYEDDFIAYNSYKIIESKKEIDSDTIIKVILNENDELIYMSRLPIPFNKPNKKYIKYYKQVCVYGFTKKALDIFSSYDKTRNEQYEDIEILRFIDLGFNVKMVETKYDSIAVDIPEDIKKVEKYLDEKGMN